MLFRSMAQPWYTTREVVKDALDVKETARADHLIDRAIASGARTIDGLMHRRFYPEVRTLAWDWPNGQRARSWRLWLDDNELVAATTVTAGGIVIPPGDYLLYPSSGPPYNRIEIDLSSGSALSSGATHQQTVVIAGLYGFRDDEERVGTLTADLGADQGDTATVTWTMPDLGVGDILRIDSERMIVSARTMIDSSQDIGAGLAASAADVTIPVASGNAFALGESILIDSERMLVVDIAGNNLIVKRAWDGSVLAAHSLGASIYRLAGVSLARGQLGATAAAHANGAVVYRHRPPSLISSLNEALAINELLQKRAGYARVAGAGDNQREVSGRGIRQLSADAYAAYGRKARLRGV